MSTLDDTKEKTPNDDTDESPELDEAFFETAVLTRPGESLIDALKGRIS